MYPSNTDIPYTYTHIYIYIYTATPMFRPQILALNGLSIKDFESQTEALATADELIAESMSLHDFEHQQAYLVYLSINCLAFLSYLLCFFPHQAPCNSQNPLLLKFWYVHSKGVKRSLKEVEAKKIEGDMDVSKAKKHMPMVDVWTGTDGSVETQTMGTVKVESSAHTAMLTEKERLRLSIDQANYRCV
jgi:hypothetical protein